MMQKQQTYGPVLRKYNNVLHVMTVAPLRVPPIMECRHYVLMI
jgi:hypothetical protein